MHFAVLLTVEMQNLHDLNQVCVPVRYGCLYNQPDTNLSNCELTMLTVSVCDPPTLKSLCVPQIGVNVCNKLTINFVCWFSTDVKLVCVRGGGVGGVCVFVWGYVDVCLSYFWKVFLHRNFQLG